MLSNGMILRGRYRIVRCIGKGGSSSVYLAEDVSIGKKWAVKFIASKDDDTGWLAQNEINMMIRLDYEMFPRIVDAWQESEGYVIVSDYIEGITLDKVLKKRPVARKMMVDWWTSIAEAIRYLHMLKPSILYLDLKLENIMLKNDGSLKLIDFGIAGRIADRGSLYGTVGYAAPEQYFNRGELLDERTDVFAFGMLMYAMISRRRPVKELKDQERMIRKDRKVPAKLKSIILNCINEEKDKRYGSMDELLRALQTLRAKRFIKLRVAACAGAAVISLVMSGIFAVRHVLAESVVTPAAEMAGELKEHIKGGEYTDEGIRIICGYLEAGCLDAETTNRFSYEVARHYFSVKRNYREALRYFNPVDEEVYPDVVYYKQLCGIQLSFEEDNEKYAGCIKEFEDYNRGLGYEAIRFENTIMLANLYEGIRCSQTDYVQAETECLEEGLKDLRYAVMTGLFADENNSYEAEYCRRLCILFAEREDKQNAVKYGEEALKLLAERDRRASEDIRDRLKALEN